jgi:hypothetical protein
MTADRKHATAELWITVALAVVLAGYPLSFGPACWLVDWGSLSSRTASRVYWPIVVATGESETVRSAANLYAGIGAEWPEWTVIRIMDAAELIPFRSGMWPRDMRHDIPHRSSDW